MEQHSLLSLSVTFKNLLSLRTHCSCLHLAFLYLLSLVFAVRACRYWVKPNERQSTFKRSEHRDALHYFAFATAGLFGHDDVNRQGHHSALTWSQVELASILKTNFDSLPKMWRQAKAVCRRLTRWAEEDMQALFGQKHTTMAHRELAHLHDEFHLRGNVDDASTGVNEEFHKMITRAFEKTNKTRRGAAL